MVFNTPARQAYRLPSRPGLSWQKGAGHDRFDRHQNPLAYSGGPFLSCIFRLWKVALKDDETLLDEAIASVHEQMTSLDQARAERVMSLIIRRRGDAKEAFKAVLMAIRTQGWPPTKETLST